MAAGRALPDAAPGIDVKHLFLCLRGTQCGCREQATPARAAPSRRRRVSAAALFRMASCADMVCFWRGYECKRGAGRGIDARLRQQHHLALAQPGSISLEYGFHSNTDGRNNNIALNVADNRRTSGGIFARQSHHGCAWSPLSGAGFVLNLIRAGFIATRKLP
jgi:hypothetical protein